MLQDITSLRGQATRKGRPATELELRTDAGQHPPHTSRPTLPQRSVHLNQSTLHTGEVGCTYFKNLWWLGTDMIDLGTTLAEPYSCQLSVNQPNVSTRSRVFISGNNACVWSTRQATIYMQTNGGGKGRKMTTCVVCFVSKCQVVSEKLRVYTKLIGFERKCK